MKNKNLALIAGSIVMLIGIFFMAERIYKKNQTQELATAMFEDQTKFTPDYAPRLGSQTPKVHLVEFLDPECESCREFYPYVKMILNDFKDVQLVVRYAPFHGNSKFIIHILEAARKQNRYWETLEVLFRYQPQWGSHHHPNPELVWTYLPEAGVDVERIKTDMKDPEIDAMIEKEIASGRELGVQATPTFFVNGKPLETFSYEALRALVQSEL